MSDKMKKTGLPPKKQVDVLLSLHRRGRMRDVVARGSRLAKQYPSAPALRNMIGSALAAQGQHGRATGHFQKAIEIDPTYAPTHHNLGLSVSAMGHLDAALANFRMALQLQPSNVEFALTVNAALGESGRRTEGIELLAHLARQVPSDPVWQLKLGRQLTSMRRREEALAAFMAGLMLDPDNADLHVEAGAQLTALGRPSEALHHFQSAVVLSPNNGPLFRVVGNHWFRWKDFDKAVLAYQRAIEIDPSTAETYAALAAVQNKQGLVCEAIDNYRKCLGLDPDNAQAAHLLAAITGETTGTAPIEYVANLFDSYAKHFDESLVGALEYQIPRVLAAMLAEHCSESHRFVSALDLGCGTGLSGMALVEHVQRIDGIDLSREMIEIARERGIYDELGVIDIVSGIAIRPHAYDLFVSADVLVYVGALEALFDTLKKHASSGALFLFSTELDESTTTYSLRASGRYAHSLDYVKRVCRERQMEILEFQTGDLRKEAEEMLVGGLYLVRIS